jgi:hypothetical protein
LRAGGKNVDYYEIAVRQFVQQVLPTSLLDGHYPQSIGARAS